MKSKSSNKYFYLEMLRVIAIFFVVFNHTGSTGFFLFSLRKPGSILYWLYSFISVFCKFAVPVFFMISGSLLLKQKDESLKKIYSKRISKIAISLIAFSIIYYIYLSYMFNEPLDFLIFLKKLITCTVNTHLWYLYMYLAFLMTLPFLRAIIKNIKREHYYYMIILSIIFTGIIPTLTYLIFQEKFGHISIIQPFWILNNVVLYPCVGYFIDQKLKIREYKKRLTLIWAINIVCIIITALMIYYSYIQTGILTEKDSQFFHNYFTLINAIAIFLTVKVACTKINRNSKICDIILNFGKYVFGIYLIHSMIIRAKEFSKCVQVLKSININEMLIAFIMTTVVIIISFVITYILSRIKGIKKIVGF